MALQLTPQDVARIAELARLDLEADEVPALARQLTTILEFAAQIQTVDADAAEPVRAGSAAWREDQIGPCLPREEVLEQAPDARKDAGLFRVPKVL